SGSPSGSSETSRRTYLTANSSRPSQNYVREIELARRPPRRESEVDGGGRRSQRPRSPSDRSDLTGKTLTEDDSRSEHTIRRTRRDRSPGDRSEYTDERPRSRERRKHRDDRSEYTNETPRREGRRDEKDDRLGYTGSTSESSRPHLSQYSGERRPRTEYGDPEPVYRPKSPQKPSFKNEYLNKNNVKREEEAYKKAIAEMQKAAAKKQKQREENLNMEAREVAKAVLDGKEKEPKQKKYYVREKGSDKITAMNKNAKNKINKTGERGITVDLKSKKDIELVPEVRKYEKFLQKRDKEAREEEKFQNRLDGVVENWNRDMALDREEEGGSYDRPPPSYYSDDYREEDDRHSYTSRSVADSSRRGGGRDDGSVTSSYRTDHRSDTHRSRRSRRHDRRRSRSRSRS
ncbi:hypothetical protein ACMFMG_010182, partial [Clarireedia jacksonii]